MWRTATLRSHPLFVLTTMSAHDGTPAQVGVDTVVLAVNYKPELMAAKLKDEEQRVSCPLHAPHTPSPAKPFAAV